MTLLRGRRFGDRRIRVERVEPQSFSLPTPKRLRPPPSAAVVLVAGFALMVAIGTVVLMLPPMSATGAWTDPLIALFTSTSAVCVTGLVVVDTATHWSPLGQVAILVLIQVGGFGFMTSSTLLLFVLIRRRTSLRDRVLVQESLGVPQLGDVGAVVRRVGIFTLICEVGGATALTIGFARPDMNLDLRQAAWWGVFHSITAFNNAGFDLTGDFRSLIAFSGDALVLVPLGVLIVLGGFGYAIVADAMSKRRWSVMAVETRLVLATTVALIVIGAGLILALEGSNPRTLGALPMPDRLLGAVFESVSLRSAGFSTQDLSAFAEATLLVMIGLIFIGGASGSTAGGIKITTFSVLLAAIISTVRGRPWVEAFGRRIPESLIYRATAVALLSIAFVFVVTLALVARTDVRLIDAAFETVSAFGTNGMSTGTTRVLDPGGLLITALAMFVGRLGPLTLVLALAARARRSSYKPAVESIRIG
jgi:trk system potassium uptake protein